MYAATGRASDAPVDLTAWREVSTRYHIRVHVSLTGVSRSPRRACSADRGSHPDLRNDLLGAAE